MSDTDIVDGETFHPIDSHIGRMVAAQLVEKLHRITIEDVLADRTEFVMTHPSSTDIAKVTLRATVEITMTHGDYLTVAFPYPIGALTAAANGLAAEYRRQQDAAPFDPNRLGIHPDTVDLWQADIAEHIGQLRPQIAGIS